jgi:hypothetical protein
MRALRLAAAIVAALLMPLLASPAGASPSVQAAFSIPSVSANAGAVEVFTVTRTAGGKGLYVLFETSDVTAKAGTDYSHVKQLLYFRASQVSATVSVPTFVNPRATGTLQFNVAISAGSSAVRATGKIVEPAPAPPPPPPTQTCADGTVLLTTDTCPSPPPPPLPPPPIPEPQWVLAPVGTAHYARCKTVGGCHSESAPCPSRIGANPPEVCTSPNIIAQQGDVREYRWGGCDAGNPCRRLADLWPLGHDPKKTGIASDWFLGVAGFEDEWEGVVPAS